MIDIERRTAKSKHTYDDACERLRQRVNLSKEKKSTIERVQEKFLPKVYDEKYAADFDRSSSIICY
jgi:hypothetical protein